MKGFSEIKPMFSARLYDAMTKINMPAVSVAKAAGINRRTIWRYLNPVFPDLPRADTLLNLSEVLGCGIYYLLGKEENK